MNGARLEEILDLLHLSARSLAEDIGCNHTLILRWLAGGAAIPDEVADWLERLAAFRLKNPPPRDWKLR